MRHNRRRHIDSSGSGKSVQLLSLSLFIMLLAFFIVMNGVSSFEENRAEPILGSLENTFSTANSPVAQKRPSTRAAEAQGSKGEGQATTLQRVDALFTGHIAAYKAKANTTTGIMMIEVPYAEFSTALLVIGQQATQNAQDDLPFLPTLVSLLKTGQRNDPYRLELLLGLDKTPHEMLEDDPEAFKSARDKIAKLGRRLDAAGIPARQINIGLHQGQDNMLTLIFRPYHPLNYKAQTGGQ